MRGTRNVCVARVQHGRIIPAHAGNSDPLDLLTSALVGSSPRMRGTHPNHLRRVKPNRIIPAHAGNSRPARTRRLPISDHPRACGELWSYQAVSATNTGSSPRMRGTRGRSARTPVGVRIIPAHAGNSRPPGVNMAFTSDHPRACGELLGFTPAPVNSPGSSPRMRGTRRHAASH